MIKRILARATVAVALGTLMAGPAQATEDGPAFELYFYDDANHTTLVGWASAECYPGPHARLHWGYSTPYEELNYVGQCVDGYLVPG